MKLTNRNNYPDALMRAIARDPYSKGDSQFSITGLIAPARKRVLEKKHWDELEEDVEECVYRLLGQSAHVILERANIEDLAEKRFFIEVDGIKISGQVDALSLTSGILTDWKVTTVYKFKTDEAAPEWIAQLNMQLEISRQNGLDADRLQIVGILRDWSRAHAMSCC